MTNHPDQPQEMNPLDALRVLEQAAGQAPLNRASHVAVQQAVQVIARTLQEAQLSGKNEPGADTEKKPIAHGRQGKIDTRNASRGLITTLSALEIMKK